MRRYDDIDDFDNLDIDNPTNDDFSLQPFTPPADVNNSESDDFSCGGGGGGRRKRRTHEHGHGHGYGGGFNWEILEIIGIIILIIAVISFIVVNRDAIEQFVQQILHWAVLLFIAFILIRIIIRKI